MGRFRFDLVAVAASLLALVMLFVYLSVIDQQEGDVALWAVAVLVAGVLALVAAVRAGPEPTPSA